MNARAFPLAAGLAVVFASASMADIGGSTYEFTASSTGNTQIGATNGTYTDPANPGFCVGPPVACDFGSGLSGSFSFADITSTTSKITFSFFGSTAGGGPGTFSIDLGNFTGADTIANVSYASGNLQNANFSSVTWNGTHAIFTGSTGTNYAAIGGATVVFNVTTVPHALTIPTVGVGDLGNPNDPATGNNFGGVSTAYSIGKYEVTVGQYTEFLNAVADTDTYGLYNENMANDLNIAGISRSGSPGSYVYSVIGSANHPVTYVNWGDAARFANWLHNGQPGGAQAAGTTETGAYTLNGETGAGLWLKDRNPGAGWFIPTDDEWYKAAYYQPAAQGGDSDNYWQYATKTNSMPYSDQPPGATPDNTRVANFRKNDSVANGYDDGYAVSGTTSFPGGNALTDVGAYTSSPSDYGTFDQSGNVWEWTEFGTQGGRVRRGGSWLSEYPSVGAFGRILDDPTGEGGILGFRVARLANPEDFGDYNHNGVVDTGDYVVWRKNDGTPSGYQKWRKYYGLALNGAGAGADLSSVPEPAPWLWFFIGAAWLSSAHVVRRRVHYLNERNPCR